MEVVEESIEKKTSNTPVDPNVLTFIRQSDATFRNGFESEEMKEAFISSVFDYIQGYEKKLSYMKSCSFIMDSFIQYASGSHIAKFFKEISEEFLEFSDCQCSCHVLEKALNRYVILLNKGKIKKKDKKSIAENLIGWSQKIASDRETMSGFISGSYTSHVARSYFQALAGIYFPSETDEKNMMYKQNISKKEVVVPEENLNKKLLKLFKNISIGLCTFDRKASIEMITNASGSPFFACLLKIARLRSMKILNLLSCWIVSPANAMESNSTQVVLLCKDKQASRVMETIFSVGSKQACLHVYNIMIEEEELMKLVLHPSANFVVQRMISCRFLQYKERFSKLFSLLCSNLNILYQNEKMGVVLKLAEQCLVRSEYQKELISSLMDFYECDQSENLLYLVATNKKFSQCKSALQYSEQSNQRQAKVTYHGSVLIQALLKFDDIEFLLSGFLKLSTNHIMSFVSCGPGSHIIDSFFKLENIQLDEKIKLLEHILNTCIIQMACDKYGSRIVENIWKLFNVDIRNRLCEALCEDSSKVASDRFGRHIFYKFSLRLFQNGNFEKWQSMMTDLPNNKRKHSHVNTNGAKKMKKK